MQNRHFWKNSPKSQKNACVGVSFFFFEAAAANFIKKETPAQVFSCKIYVILKNISLTEYLRETVSENSNQEYCNLLKTNFIEI